MSEVRSMLGLKIILGVLEWLGFSILTILNVGFQNWLFEERRYRASLANCVSDAFKNGYWEYCLVPVSILFGPFVFAFTIITFVIRAIMAGFYAIGELIYRIGKRTEEKKSED